MLSSLQTHTAPSRKGHLPFRGSAECVSPPIPFRPPLIIVTSSQSQDLMKWQCLHDSILQSPRDSWYGGSSFDLTNVSPERSSVVLNKSREALFGISREVFGFCWFHTPGNGVPFRHLGWALWPAEPWSWQWSQRTSKDKLVLGREEGWERKVKGQLISSEF